MIHLGTHQLSHDFPEPLLLMEVMPSVLARRSFLPPISLARLEPGFRESPDPFFPMALMFLKVRILLLAPALSPSLSLSLSLSCGGGGGGGQCGWRKG